MTSSAHRSGFSVIEVLVASAVMLFLLGGLYLLLVGGARHFQHGRAYQTAQQEATVAIRRLELELQNTDPGSVFFDNAAPTPHIIFLSATTDLGGFAFDPAGGILWNRWVCYYLNEATREMTRSELDVAPPQIAPPYPARPALPAFQAAPSPQRRRVVARSLERVGDPFLTGATGEHIAIRLAGRQDTASDRFTRVELTTEVRMLNKGP
ncbi:MAG: prepilin-type N-terminal cleavage/methylation domain-containing protein [Candidatus Eremiobacterota bacterium]